MQCIKNFDLKNFNTYKISSIADVIYFPESIEEFVELLKTIEKPFILGGGSNILFSSQGVEQPIISTLKLNKVSDLLFETGVKAPFAARLALEASLSGFEFLATIPGTIGGAVTMNASAHAQAISDTFEYAQLFDFNERAVKNFSHEQMQFDYRTSVLKNGEYAFISAKFKLLTKSVEEIKNRIDENLKYRKIHQPDLKTPNAGSVFKNPSIAAGKLIEQCNLKGKKIGGAQISMLHGNFIISDNATSDDIVKLMFLAYNEVKKQTNIELESEIIFVGRTTETKEQIWEKISKKPNA